MLEPAHESAPASASAKVVGGPARFARDPDEFTAAPKNFISPAGPERSYPAPEGVLIFDLEQ